MALGFSGGNIKELSQELKERLRSGVAVCSFTQCIEELVLNSIDAKATCIAVRVDITLGKIQVVDNGIGLTKQQLKQIGTRYLTSKCHDIKDLDNLTEYGFRGEALASIADICHTMEIESRSKSSALSYVCTFQYGRRENVIESGTPRPSVGTTVTIFDLFRSMPVRKKGINAALEIENIKKRLIAITLLHPLLSLSLRNDSSGMKILQTHKSNSVLGVFTHLFGIKKAQCMCEVAMKKDELNIEGYIGKEGNSSKNLQFVYINRRLVLKTKIHKLVNGLCSKHLFFKNRKQDESPMNSKAGINEKLQQSPGKSEKKHGIYIINILCPLSFYDITFDPAKTFVEFKDWDPVLHIVEDSILSTLKHNGLVMQTAESEIIKDNSSGENQLLKEQERSRECAIICTEDSQFSLHSKTVKRPVVKVGNISEEIDTKKIKLNSNETEIDCDETMDENAPGASLSLAFKSQINCDKSVKSKNITSTHTCGEATEESQTISQMLTVLSTEPESLRSTSTQEHNLHLSSSQKSCSLIYKQKTTSGANCMLPNSNDLSSSKAQCSRGELKTPCALSLNTLQSSSYSSFKSRISNKSASLKPLEKLREKLSQSRESSPDNISSLQRFRFQMEKSKSSPEKKVLHQLQKVKERVMSCNLEGRADTLAQKSNVNNSSVYPNAVKPTEANSTTGESHITSNSLNTMSNSGAHVNDKQYDQRHESSGNSMKNRTSHDAHVISQQLQDYKVSMNFPVQERNHMKRSLTEKEFRSRLKCVCDKQVTFKAKAFPFRSETCSKFKQPPVVERCFPSTNTMIQTVHDFVRMLPPEVQLQGHQYVHDKKSEGHNQNGSEDFKNSEETESLSEDLDISKKEGKVCSERLENTKEREIVVSEQNDHHQVELGTDISKIAESNISCDPEKNDPETFISQSREVTDTANDSQIVFPSMVSETEVAKCDGFAKNPFVTSTFSDFTVEYIPLGNEGCSQRTRKIVENECDSDYLVERSGKRRTKTVHFEDEDIIMLPPHFQETQKFGNPTSSQGFDPGLPETQPFEQLFTEDVLRENSEQISRQKDIRGNLSLEKNQENCNNFHAAKGSVINEGFLPESSSFVESTHVAIQREEGFGLNTYNYDRDEKITSVNTDKECEKEHQGEHVDRITEVICPQTGKQLYIECATGKTSFVIDDFQQKEDHSHFTTCFSGTMEGCIADEIGFPTSLLTRTHEKSPINLSQRSKENLHKMFLNHTDSLQGGHWSKWREPEEVENSMDKEPKTKQKSAELEPTCLIVTELGKIETQIQRTFKPVRFTKEMLNTVKVLKQVDNKFIVCLMNTDTKNQCFDSNLVVVIDQHAAHERIRLEELIQDAYEDGTIHTQLKSSDVTPPLDVKLTDSHVRLVQEYRATFSKLGIKFEVSQSDRNSIIVHSVPACLIQREANELKRGRQSVAMEILERLIQEQVELLESTSGANSMLPRTVTRLLSSLACHGAVKFGDPLEKSECEQIVASLKHCNLPFQCAHGRPSILPLLNMADMDGKFERKSKKPSLSKLREKCQSSKRDDR